MTKHNKKLLFLVGQSCMNVRTGTQEQDLQFHQAEVDTIMFSIHHTLLSKGIHNDVILDTRDTDNYVAAAYQSHMYPEMMGIKRGQHVIDCKKFVEPDMVHCVIPMYIMTGNDQVSVFLGKVRVPCSKKSRRVTEQKISWNTVGKMKN